jgi:hypothetical protein
MDQSDRRNALGAMLAIGIAATAEGANAATKAPKNDMAKQLDELLSRTQISDVLMAYARANDRVDEALLRSCFWPESTHKHGRFDGTSTDFIGFAMKIIGTLKFTAHHISNVSIQVNGDRALSECYYLAHHRRDRKEGGGEEDAWFEGRYLDDFERRNGVWKIIRRRGLADYTAAATPAPTPYAEWPAGQHSLRYPEDDFYKMQSAFRGS